MQIKNLSFLYVALMAFGMAFTFTACDDDEPMEEVIPTTDLTITTNLANDDNFSILVSALERTGLDDVLNQTGPFTLFAPTDAAFTASGIDLAAVADADLAEILLYHVLGASVASTDLAEGQTYATTASTNSPDGSQLSILVERSGSTVTLNGDISVTEADLNAQNGIIHTVDKVILPISVVDAAVDNSAFTELVGALGAASGGLVDVLSGDGPFTVFAPVNAAFEEIASTTATLSADQLRDVLLYHVVAGNVRSSALSDGMMVTTVNGDTFVINIAGDAVTITDAGGGESTVVLTDVQTTNGVVHVLNKVIIPTL